MEGGGITLNKNRRKLIFLIVSPVWTKLNQKFCIYNQWAPRRLNMQKLTTQNGGGSCTKLFVLLKRKSDKILG